MDPSNLHTRDSLAMAQAFTGHPLEALQNSQMAMSSPYHAASDEVTYGMALYVNGRHEEAFKAWQHAAASSNPEVRRLAGEFQAQSR